MSSSDVAKSTRVLDKIGARLGLTEAGKQWLIAAVDPFHDTPLQVTGFPDVNEAASVVQVVKQSAQIATKFDANTNWDCHFHQFPWLHTSGLVPGNMSQTVGGDQATGFGTLLFGTSTTTPTPGTASNVVVGGMVVSQAPSGFPTFEWTNDKWDVPFDVSLRPYLVGEYRVIAMGYEIINTTSDLNIQGLVTCYRQPMASIDSAQSILALSGPVTAGSAINYTQGYPSVVFTNMPPVNTAEALLLEGSKQWKAKEGAYVVPTLNSQELPAGENNTTALLHISTADTSAPAAWGYARPDTGIPSGFGLSFAISGTTYNIGQVQAGSSQLQPFNHSGVYFSGLSPSTTLTINATYYIERFPTQQDSALVVLARESPRFDCVALDLYSEIIREMPVGVPQRMNGLGEWFADAVSSAVDFVSPVLSAIPHPIAQGAVMMGKTAKNVANAIGGKSSAPGAVYAPTGNNVVKKPVAMVVVQKKKKKVPLKKK